MTSNSVRGIRAAALVALAALGAGCQTTQDETAVPAETPAPGPSATAPPTAAASTSPTAVTAANTAAVCKAVDQVIITGSRKIAADSDAATERELTAEQLNDQLKRSIAGMADDVREQAARAQDPEIKGLLTGTAEKIDAGARASSPTTWLHSTFTTIPATLSQECRV